MSWNVLVTARPIAEIGRTAAELLENAGARVRYPEAFGPLPASKIEANLDGADAVLASSDAFTPEVLASAAARNLKIVSRWGVGYDSIHIPSATAAGIVIAYTPGFLDDTVADYAFGLLMTISRRISAAEAALREGRWKQHWGGNIHGKTLGVIGCGRIGLAMAARASGFNMRVLGSDVHPLAPTAPARQVSLDELLEQSDFVSLHSALTPENRGMIGREQLRRMKKTACLINTARGALIDEDSLAEALHEGAIAGAALDVFATEPLPRESPLLSAPNLLLSPHQASFTVETGERVSMAAAQAIVDLMRGKRPQFVVNGEVFEKPHLRASLGPA